MKDDRWYKAKISIIDADEVSGKESLLHNITWWQPRISTGIGKPRKKFIYLVVPYEINSIADTQFMDVFPYFSDEEEQIPENLKLLEKEEAEENGEMEDTEA